MNRDSSIYDPNATSIERTLSPARPLVASRLPFLPPSLTLPSHFSQTGAIDRTTYGPSFFDTFSSLPEGTTFVIPLNFGNDTYQIAEDAARAAWEQVDHDSVWAFELGNESGNYKNTSRDFSTWNEGAYVKQWTVSRDSFRSTRRLPSLVFRIQITPELIISFLPIHHRTGRVPSTKLSISLNQSGSSPRRAPCDPSPFLFRSSIR